MSDSVNVFSNIINLDVSPQLEACSKVIIHVSDEKVYVAENTGASGRTLEIDNPFGTKAMADALLEAINRSDYRFQPYDAQGTILNPAAEMGDALNSTKVYGGIYTRSRTFGRLMKADVSAPYAEEINHEYRYESPQEREFKRETGKLSARLIIAESTIESQASRIDGLSEEVSTIKQTSGEISAEVMKREGGDNSTFGWTLNDTSWVLKANGQNVFKADASGVEITGKITASSGKIGGFTISASAIYKGTSSLTNTSNGVYVGTNGIRIVGTRVIDGKNVRSTFTADSAGNVKMTGRLWLGDQEISTGNLRSGAQSAYTNGGTWSTGAGYGYSYNRATDSSSGSYPSFFKVNGSLQCGQLSIGGSSCAKYMAIINGVHIPYWGYGAPY